VVYVKKALTSMATSTNSVTHGNFKSLFFDCTNKKDSIEKA
jgi:hypothetical protein